MFPVAMSMCVESEDEIVDSFRFGRSLTADDARSTESGSVVDEPLPYESNRCKMRVLTKAMHRKGVGCQVTKKRITVLWSRPLLRVTLQTLPFLQENMKNTKSAREKIERATYLDK